MSWNTAPTVTLPWSSHGWWCHHSPLTCQQRRRKWRHDERWRRWSSQGVARWWTLPQSLRRLHHQQPKQRTNSLQWRQTFITLTPVCDTRQKERQHRLTLTVRFSLVQDGIYALGKTHKCATHTYCPIVAWKKVHRKNDCAFCSVPSSA